MVVLSVLDAGGFSLKMVMAILCHAWAIPFLLNLKRSFSLNLSQKHAQSLLVSYPSQSLLCFQSFFNVVLCHGNRIPCCE